MRYLEQISEGEEVVFEDVYHVTEEEIIEVGNRWDPQTFHTDPEAAKRSIFGGLVASSAHIFAIWVRIGHAPIDADKNIASVSALGFDNLRWHEPARPGDTLRNSFVIISIRESKSRPGLGVVVTHSRVYNQRDETVFTAECSFLVPRSNYQVPDQPLTGD